MHISKDLRHGGFPFTSVNGLNSSVSLQLGWFVKLLERIFTSVTIKSGGCTMLYASCVRWGEAWTSSQPTLFHIPSLLLNYKKQTYSQCLMSLCLGQLFTTNRPPKIIRKKKTCFVCFSSFWAAMFFLNSNQWLASPIGHDSLLVRGAATAFSMANDLMEIDTDLQHRSLDTENATLEKKCLGSSDRPISTWGKMIVWWGH